MTILDLTGTPQGHALGLRDEVSGLTAKLEQRRREGAQRHVRRACLQQGHPARQGAREGACRPRPSCSREAPTTLAIDPGALAAIVGLGVTPGMIGPATLDGTTARSRSRAGASALDLSAAEVTPRRRHLAHQGRDGGQPDRLRHPASARGAQLFAAVNGGAAKVAILDVDLTGVTPAVSGRDVTLARRHRAAHAGRRRRTQRRVRHDRLHRRPRARARRRSARPASSAARRPPGAPAPGGPRPTRGRRAFAVAVGVDAVDQAVVDAPPRA